MKPNLDADEASVNAEAWQRWCLFINHSVCGVNSGFCFFLMFFFYLWVNLWAKSNFSNAHLHSSLIKCEGWRLTISSGCSSRFCIACCRYWVTGQEGNSRLSRQLIVNSFKAFLIHCEYSLLRLLEIHAYSHWHLAKKKKIVPSTEFMLTLWYNKPFKLPVCPRLDHRTPFGAGDSWFQLHTNRWADFSGSKKLQCSQSNLFIKNRESSVLTALWCKIHQGQDPDYAHPYICNASSTIQRSASGGILMLP